VPSAAGCDRSALHFPDSDEYTAPPGPQATVSVQSARGYRLVALIRMAAMAACSTAGAIVAGTVGSAQI
jgi:hypothetical protein